MYTVTILSLHSLLILLACQCSFLDNSAETDKVTDLSWSWHNDEKSSHTLEVSDVAMVIVTTHTYMCKYKQENYRDAHFAPTGLWLLVWLEMNCLVFTSMVLSSSLQAFHQPRSLLSLLGKPKDPKPVENHWRGTCHVTGICWSSSVHFELSVVRIVCVVTHLVVAVSFSVRLRFFVL